MNVVTTMNGKHLSFLALLIALCLCGCRYDQEEVLAYSSVFGIEDYDNATAEVRNYAQFGVYTNSVTKLYVKRVNGGQKRGQIFATYKENGEPYDIDMGTFIVDDDLEIDYSAEFNVYRSNTGLPIYSEEMAAYVERYMGKKTNFKLVDDNGNDIFNEDVYVPAVLDIQHIENQGTHENAVYLEVSRNNFNFSWNKDSDNDNGILAVVMWDGNYTSTPINEIVGGPISYKSQWFKDTGEAKASAELFESFPKDAILRVTFVRAKFNIFTDDNDHTHKVYGMTQNSWDVTLID